MSDQYSYLRLLPAEELLCQDAEDNENERGHGADSSQPHTGGPSPVTHSKMIRKSASQMPRQQSGLLHTARRARQLQYSPQTEEMRRETDKLSLRGPLPWKPAGARVPRTSDSFVDPISFTSCRDVNAGNAAIKEETDRLDGPRLISFKKLHAFIERQTAFAKQRDAKRAEQLAEREAAQGEALQNTFKPQLSPLSESICRKSRSRGEMSSSPQPRSREEQVVRVRAAANITATMMEYISPEKRRKPPRSGVRGYTDIMDLRLRGYPSRRSHQPFRTPSPSQRQRCDGLNAKADAATSTELDAHAACLVAGQKAKEQKSPHPNRRRETPLVSKPWVSSKAFAAAANKSLNSTARGEATLATECRCYAQDDGQTDLTRTLSPVPIKPGTFVCGAASDRDDGVVDTCPELHEHHNLGETYQLQTHSVAGRLPLSGPPFDSAWANAITSYDGGNSNTRSANKALQSRYGTAIASREDHEDDNTSICLSVGCSDGTLQSLAEWWDRLTHAYYAGRYGEVWYRYGYEKDAASPRTMDLPLMMVLDAMQELVIARWEANMCEGNGPPILSTLALPPVTYGTSIYEEGARYRVWLGGAMDAEPRQFPLVVGGIVNFRYLVNLYVWAIEVTC